VLALGSCPDSIQSDTTSLCISLTYILLISSSFLVVLNTLNKSWTQNCSFWRIAVQSSHWNLKKRILFYRVGCFIFNRQENIAGQVFVTRYVWHYSSAWDWWQLLTCNVVNLLRGPFNYTCMFEYIRVYVQHGPKAVSVVCVCYYFQNVAPCNLDYPG
jgi:hypothetical protein